MTNPTVIMLPIRKRWDPRGWPGMLRLYTRYWHMRYRFVMGRCTRCGFAYRKAGQKVCGRCLDRQTAQIARFRAMLDKNPNAE